MCEPTGETLLLNVAFILHIKLMNFQYFCCAWRRAILVLVLTWWVLLLDSVYFCIETAPIEIKLEIFRSRNDFITTTCAL